MNKIAEMLEKFAGLVGVQVERLWPEMVRAWWLQQVFNLTCMPILIAGLLWLGIRMGSGARQSFKSPRGDQDGPGIAYAIASVCLCGSAAIFSMIYVSYFGIMVATLWYPEATYVQHLLTPAGK